VQSEEHTMPFDFVVSDVIPATPQTIYDAWLTSAGHTAMTGATAEASAEPGAPFAAWDGYISGANLELEPYSRIVQRWRTTEFTDDDPDSQIEVLLEPVPQGTLVTIHHTNVPDGHLGYQDGGWQDNYFAPMKVFFGS
jgi:activator of HSP90 ATPase